MKSEYEQGKIKEYIFKKMKGKNTPQAVIQLKELIELYQKDVEFDIHGMMVDHVIINNDGAWIKPVSLYMMEHHTDSDAKLKAIAEWPNSFPEKIKRCINMFIQIHFLNWGDEIKPSNKRYIKMYVEKNLSPYEKEDFYKQNILFDI